MAATGLGFAGLLRASGRCSLVAFMGPLNPSSGDASVFMPLDHTMLAASASTEVRTSVFARYSFVGSIFGAVGALAAAVPDWLAASAGWQMLDALRVMFVVYAPLGVVVWLLYLRHASPPRTGERTPPVPLGPSRGIVWRLAGLFSVDSFAGGLVLNSLLALWLFERFGMSLAAAGSVLLLDRLAQRGVAARRAGARAAHRPGEHDGVHAHSVRACA